MCKIVYFITKWTRTVHHQRHANITRRVSLTHILTLLTPSVWTAGWVVETDIHVLTLQPVCPVWQNCRNCWTNYALSKSCRISNVLSLCNNFFVMTLWLCGPICTAEKEDDFNLISYQNNYNRVCRAAPSLVKVLKILLIA